MRTKKEYLFDEERVAKDIVENGFEDGEIDFGKMYIIAKYFRQKEDLGAVKLERKLIDFCQEQDENFNPIVEAGLIKKWVDSAMNYNLRKVDDIIISPEDIEFLKTVETEKERKVLFVALVLSKSFKKGSTKRDKEDYKKSDRYYLRYSNFSDIIRLADLTNTTEMDITGVFHKYREHFTFYSPEKELIRLEFIDKTPERKIKIDDLQHPLKYYTLFFGDNMEKCEICGKDFVRKSNRQKYCPSCSEDVRRKQKRETIRERTNVKNPYIED
jgi:hypothetical protein